MMAKSAKGQLTSDPDGPHQAPYYIFHGQEGVDDRPTAGARLDVDNAINAGGRPSRWQDALYPLHFKSRV